jgi:hypothetical protein
VIHPERQSLKRDLAGLVRHSFAACLRRFAYNCYVRGQREAGRVSDRDSQLTFFELRMTAYSKHEEEQQTEVDSLHPDV